MSALKELLENYRQTSKTEREKGTYFEELIVTYFKNEPTYKDLYSKIWLYSDWATETMGNAKYPLELFQRVITVSLETMKIVKSLPKLNI
ncbi:hypothetical protein [Alteromonas sp. C1M14]|uniref:hypothetical protein n=1 Tax=Alteromonas sp. C1M14 TaxID=2841567 RepID=UPI001C0939D7|nr:hypothetical protein [Alteromonas sp. C1M14]MBU2979733.1 hypothetical protein [Alteromonas sp. C1M14]